MYSFRNFGNKEDDDAKQVLSRHTTTVVGKSSYQITEH